MPLYGQWLRVRALFLKERAEDEMDEELRFHMEMQIEENMRRGMNRTNAGNSALRGFGGIDQVKEECREIRGIRWIDELTQDLRYGLRMMRKHPAFTAAAVLTLALGIGANSAIFSVVYAHLLRPLPFAEPERLVSISTSSPRRGWSAVPLSPGEYDDLKQQCRGLADVAAYQGRSFVFEGDSESRVIPGDAVTTNVFTLLGVSPMLGRAFQAEEDRVSGSRPVIISRKLWQEDFGGAADIIGRHLALDNVTYTVIGVMPAEFPFPSKDTRIWVPLVPGAGRGTKSLSCIGRLRSGVALAQARAEADAISRHADSSPSAWKFDLAPCQEAGRRQGRTTLLVLFGAVGFILLIACANVANLQLARAGMRATEVAVRAALGATHLRILRQQLTENLLMGLISGVLALLVADWATRLLIALKPPELIHLENVTLNLPVLVFTLAAGLLTGLLAGLLPAVKTTRPRLGEVLKEGARPAAGALGRHRVRNFLVVAEIAMATVLLIGAGLMVRSFARLLHVDEGFDATNAITMELRLPAARYPDSARRLDFYLDLLRRMKSLPQVVAAGGTTALPTTGIDMAVQLESEKGKGEPLVVPLDAITPDYFRAIGIRILRGRAFTDDDRDGSPEAVIINETLARRLENQGDPLGRAFKLGGAMRTVVGIAADTKQLGLDQENAPQVYFPYRQWPRGYLKLVIRVDSHPQRAISALKAQVWGADRKVPITSVAMMADVVSDSVAQRRFNLILLASFSALALVLAAIGTYGVVSYTVSQRLHEIGVRVALGADRRGILGMVLGHGLRLAVLGLAVGLAGAFALTRVMTGMLFSVKATDPVTFMAASLLLAAVAMLASFMPARRATRIDPVSALRCE